MATFRNRSQASKLNLMLLKEILNVELKQYLYDSKLFKPLYTAGKIKNKKN